MTLPISVSINNLRDFQAYARAVTRTKRPAFVEVLWDNYAHIEPTALADMLHEVAEDVSLHIMYSGFLTRPRDRTRALLRRLSTFVRAVRPARVSDHVLCYTQPDSLNIVTPFEYPYDAVDDACERVQEYQDTIGMHILLENFASHQGDQCRQLDFLDTLQARTGCGLLFDVSNAVVAELNGCCPVERWVNYLDGRVVDGHIGGYTHAPKTGRVLDSHAENISATTSVLLSQLVRQNSLRTLCLERERNVTEEVLSAELDLLTTVVDAASRGDIPSLQARIRRHARDVLYLGGEDAQLVGVAPHLYWHSPFIVGSGKSGREGRIEKMRAAGDIWLTNFDLEAGAELILEDSVTSTWFLFRRRQRPGEIDMVVGPVEGSVLSGGQPLPEQGMSFYVASKPTPYVEFLR